MPTQKLHNWIGLSGVAEDENHRAKVWAKRLDIPLVLLALWIVVSWYWDSINHNQGSDMALEWGIWLFFFTETTLLCLLVNDKKRYLKENWLNLIIIIGCLPLTWMNSPIIGALQVLRALIIFNLLLQLSDSIERVLARNHLGSTLAVSVIFIVAAGYLIATIDPAITSPADGIWWAWVTATTVGYGDIVPTSTEGRIIAGILILLGIVLMSLITANTSAFFIAKQNENKENAQIKKIEQQLDRIEKQLAQLTKKD